MTDSSGDRNPVEVLAEEFIARKRRGEMPCLSEYTQKYPDLATEIRDLFPALVMMEDLGDSPPDSTGPHAGSVPTLTQLGDYRVLREVGRGGMGVVYEAEQQSLGRRVALKVLPPHALHDGQQLRRFEREAKAAARLHHTNIVPVYGVGTHAGTHYYVMQFIQGLGLDGVLEELRLLRPGKVNRPSAAVSRGNPRADRLAHATGSRLTVAAGAPRPAAQQVALSLVTGSFHPPPSDSGEGAGSTVTGGASDSSLPRLPEGSDLSSVSQSDLRYWRSVARIGVQVAGALEYAHGQGVLHRDVKPSNLLMDMNGTVWVTDFGLAKGGDGEDLTHTGDIVGTVRYMAPERFQGQSDARSDVYALGLTLYELLALRPAFAERDRARLIQQVMHEEPQALRKVNRAVPRDLETVVHKATAKEPARRYARAAELAADLQRFLDDRPIRARRVGAAERCWRWCRRNPAVAGLATAVILVTAVGFAATIAQVAEARHERDDARQQRDKADAASDKLRRTLYDADMNLVQAAWELNNTPRFLELLRRQRPEEGHSDLRDFEWHYWRRLCFAEDRSFRVPIDQNAFGYNSNHMSFSPDGKYLAVAEYPRRDNELSMLVKIWDTDAAVAIVTLQLGQTTRLYSGDQQVSLNPAGTRLSAVRGLKGQTEVSTWDLPTGTRLSQFQLPEPARRSGVVFSPDGERFAFAYPTGPTNEQPSPYRLSVRETATGKELLGLTIPCDGATPVFSPDGQRLAALKTDKVANREVAISVQVWDAASGQATMNIPQVSRGSWLGTVLAFSPDGLFLATGGKADGPSGAEVNLWDAATGKHVYGLPELTGIAYGVLFSPDGKRLGVLGSTPPTATVWEIDPRRPESLRVPLLKIASHTQKISWLAFNADGRRVYSADTAGTVKVWDAAPRTLPFDLTEEKEPHARIASVTLSHDAARLAVIHHNKLGGGNDGLTVYDAAGKRLTRIDKSLPDLRLGSLGHDSMAFSADGHRIVARTSADKTTTSGLQVCDAGTGKQIFMIEEPGECLGMGFSPGGRTLTAAFKRQPGKVCQGFKIWDAVTGKELHSVEVNGVEASDENSHAFSPDGRILAWVVRPLVAKQPSEVRFWDTATGQEIAAMRKAIEGSAGLLCPLGFSPDGRHIAARLPHPGSPGRQAEVKVWNAETGEDRFTLVGDFTNFTFSPDGRRIATTYSGLEPRGEVKLWDTATGRDLLTLRTPGRRGQVVFSPDGNRMFAVKGYHFDPGPLVQVWDATPLPHQPESDGGQ
jgi:WD40 repeat protein